ncbi:MAG: hypothetical protein AAGJ73_01475 [Pseudomonadota bacterium]
MDTEHTEQLELPTSITRSANDRRFLTALEEYKIANQRISDYDKLVLTIKSWSITLSAGAIGFAFIEAKSILFLLASLTALVFWYLEAINKNYQTALIDRSRELESVLPDAETYNGPEFGTNFKRVFGFGSTFRIFRIMLFYRNVHHPHSLIFIGGIILYFYTDVETFLRSLD